MYIMQSETTFSELCNLTDNFASTGGAIYASESTLSVYDNMLTVKFNTYR